MIRRTIPIILIGIIFFLPFSREICSGSEHRSYAVARLSTPVFNVPEMNEIFGGKDGKTLHLDGSGLIRELEFIALPDTVFHVQEVINKDAAVIYRVTTDDYPYPSRDGYYIDSRFVETVKTRPPDRVKVLPSRQTIVDNLLSAKGNIYVWGGNSRRGVPELLSFYPPGRYLSPRMEKLWTLKGLDCSGLLYEATGGYTPRNTSSLVNFGQPVDIEGLTAGEIAGIVRPLDLIAWKGHVIIVLDEDTTIESRSGDPAGGRNGGVIVRKAADTLGEILSEKVPVNEYHESGEKCFVIRRWFK